MSKIEIYLVNCPIGTTIRLFDITENDHERLSKGALSCGMELVNGKVDYEATYQIAKYSRNALVYGLDSLHEDDLLLVRDDSLSDNIFTLKYISENGDDDEEEVETVITPDGNRIYALA
jgi:hypothetical protein